jgi:hypothetical protein
MKSDSQATVFLKPSGIDGPVDNAKRSLDAHDSLNEEVFSEVPPMVKGSTKRRRETISDPKEKEGKKRKKKKKIAE